MKCRERGSHAQGMYHYTGYLAHGISNAGIRGRSRQQNNNERGVRNMEERIMGTQMIGPTSVGLRLPLSWIGLN